MKNLRHCHPMYSVFLVNSERYLWKICGGGLFALASHHSKLWGSPVSSPCPSCDLGPSAHTVSNVSRCQSLDGCLLISPWRPLSTVQSTAPTPLPCKKPLVLCWLLTPHPLLESIFTDAGSLPDDSAVIITLPTESSLNESSDFI